MWVFLLQKYGKFVKSDKQMSSIGRDKINHDEIYDHYHKREGGTFPSFSFEIMIICKLILVFTFCTSSAPLLN